ncbi:MAG: hypothetical protein JO117_03045 [Verrucomicrobia bacterium]|nr:hypothetical protein [Verrucomicrobiota bacterium]MBV9658835.1 hypothetical protein [Verrucomicrobiota bacterium]
MTNDECLKALSLNSFSVSKWIKNFPFFRSLNAQRSTLHFPPFVIRHSAFVFFLLLPLCARARPFDYRRDSLAFPNETVFEYRGGQVLSRHRQKPKKEREYSRRCFVVARAAVQFWKFARFDPAAPPLADDDALAARVRAVTRRSVWRAALPERERVVFPGYRDLRELSKARVGVLQENLGLGWPTYFRFGNFGILWSPTGERQARTAAEIDAALARGEPTILWLINFPSLSMNHSVVVLAREPASSATRQTIYRVYDPNYTDAPRRLTYRTDSHAFFYDKTFYFGGGEVHVKPIYRDVWK